MKNVTRVRLMASYASQSLFKIKKKKKTKCKSGIVFDAGYVILNFSLHNWSVDPNKRFMN